MPVTREQLERMAAASRTGGKGSVRRTKKVQHRTNAADDKKLQASLKKLGVSPIGDIEEVNLIMDNGNVIHFSHPKVQASIPSNTYVVTGTSETKKLQQMLPQIINQLGSENVEQLKQIAKGLDGKDGKEDIPDTEDFE
eukprot:NODE_2702_length_753_cov_1365.803977_g1895_i0.p2 GENE.NODE_2702_length_753_cov_1365.803977_g1895_i0~~NODE_2702_length_753_cov_1365.803977_g1895_i0.p2  ORF type:complete len:139 (-),score=62.41 NODE_2702_length_753_cov_1365.803977_g1895_i0:266-682(-)